MKNHDTIPSPMAPGAHARARRALRRGQGWRHGAVALLALGAALWWLWPSALPDPVQALGQAPVPQALHAGQAWPFGAGAPAVEPQGGSPVGASPWDRLRPPGEADADESLGPDPRQHNAAIDPARLSVHRPQAARAFLDHVVLQPEPRGGWTVDAVLPGSLYERAGLRPGDTVYSLDLPGQPVVDESNMGALTSVHELAWDVVRAGGLVRLSVRLNEEAAGNEPS
ncbi:MAG TPA: hypothetical protein DET46_10910 [Comamonadaceae bacterium]|nr:MAG: hypothetical protein A3F76_14165 [Burkholderiales bacterium RIFCSPLOWO2_12_FULL_65_40]HCE29187.1 hypothetical protein [Comamonadaceae bacterium]